MKKFSPPWQALAVLLTLALAWALRANAVSHLPVDYDEDDYLRAAQEYAAVLRSGDWRGLMSFNYRAEHPPLAKILFGAAIAADEPTPLIPDRPTNASPDQTLPRPQLTHARSLAAALGALTAATLALINPLGGLLLAIHPFTIKYTSQVMLEALPALTSLLAALTYLRAKNSPRRAAWLILSAVLLGLTAAAKYLYALAGVAILADWLWQAHSENRLRQAIAPILAWGGLALLIFFAADPYLWPGPLGRLRESLFYHLAYSSGAAEVKQADSPFYQPFVWLFFSPYWWGRNGVFIFPFDPFLSLLALPGLARLWRKERVFALWIGITLFFLLLWPTKWPQYLITYSAPLMLAAGEGLWATVIEPLKKFLARRFSPAPAGRGSKNEGRRALPWLIPGLLAFAALTIFPLLFQVGVSLTNFNQNSLRNAFQQGGLIQAVWGGISGQTPALPLQEFPFHSPKVNFIGGQIYLQALGYVIGQGILPFDLLWTVLSVSLQSALGLGLALILWQKGLRLEKFWQALFILPWAIPEMIGALMWVNVFQPETGWLALAVKQFGAGIPFGFFNGWEQSTNLWLLVFLIPALWYGFPFMMMAASAGLKNIPQEALDSAALDGASPWQTFRFILWPLLQPLLLPAIIIRGIFAFNQFYLFQAFFALEATLATFSYNIFNSGGFHRLAGQYALSAVVNVIAVFALAGFVLLFNRWSRADEGVTYA
ncbi:MAG: hypothetical protein OHK0031_05750 [Anaerolineales bacterium]